MSNASAALQAICHYRAIAKDIGSAGQPTEAQLREIHDAGFEVVINLALPSSDNALLNEGSLVTALGMSYVHIPIDFAGPTTSDFQFFCGVMNALAGRPAFIHCAANKRVSAFLYLYRVLQLGEAPEKAAQDLQAIWEPNAVWREFIQETLKHGVPA